MILQRLSEYSVYNFKFKFNQTKNQRKCIFSKGSSNINILVDRTFNTSFYFEYLIR